MCRRSYITCRRALGVVGASLHTPLCAITSDACTMSRTLRGKSWKSGALVRLCASSSDHPIDRVKTILRGVLLMIFVNYWPCILFFRAASIETKGECNLTFESLVVPVLLYLSTAATAATTSSQSPRLFLVAHNHRVLPGVMTTLESNS